MRSRISTSAIPAVIMMSLGILLLLNQCCEGGKIPAKSSKSKSSGNRRVVSKSPETSSSEEEMAEGKKDNLVRQGRRYNPLSDEEEEFCYTRPECAPGSEQWGGACVMGMRQSPIDINFKKVVPSPFNGPVYLNPDYRDRQNFLMMNTGHTVSVMLNSDLSSRATIRLDGAKELMGGSTHVFSQLHFHWGSQSNVGSEHTLNGQRFAMEAHFVHYNNRYENFTTALNEPNGLTVVAVFFDESPMDNPALEPVVENLGKVRNTRKFARGQGLEFTGLLPVMSRHPTQAYHYFGSLTTPQCMETVQWVVCEKHLSISRRQLDAFRSLIDSNGDRMQNNFRPLQPLNMRKISRITVFCGDHCEDSDMSLPPPVPTISNKLDEPFPIVIIGPQLKPGGLSLLDKILSFLSICIYIITILWIIVLHKANGVAQTSNSISQAFTNLSSGRWTEAVAKIPSAEQWANTVNGIPVK